MSVLKRIPMDGTFNQRAPLRRLVGAKDCFSYDLSSATDRWPLILMHDIVMYFFDKSLASMVRLGYYSSWALFALSHHLIVWLTAEEVYPGQVFNKYAVLGDDVLIVDKQIGPVYKFPIPYELGSQ
ncbi:hypothetical protein M9H77_16976 [Catharanthus roseus]|uniref:Uncharacterized protein n=1 Tax=Catharanthus roseus TaxID=4058 RepID=A0ACC0B3B5_CATRO|nr:hypothetical protein M9H77_16976 [Catharanthus roseus]